MSTLYHQRAKQQSRKQLSMPKQSLQRPVAKLPVIRSRECIMMTLNLMAFVCVFTHSRLQVWIFHRPKRSNSRKSKYASYIREFDATSTYRSQTILFS